MKIVLATANQHKVQEIRQILEGYPWELWDLSMFPAVEPPEEVGSTYRENAQLKAHFYAQHTGMTALADDSGLEIEALQGAPGLYSARFAPELSQADKNLEVIRLLRERGGASRGARFVCCSCLYDPLTQRNWIQEASCQGHIGDYPQGQQGFGYDPIFLVNERQSMAELSDSEKHRISHRGLSLRGLFEQLQRDHIGPRS